MLSGEKNVVRFMFFVIFACKEGRLADVECFLTSHKCNYVFDFSAASLRKRPAKLALLGNPVDHPLFSLALAPSFCFPALMNGCHSSVFGTNLLHLILGLCFIPNCDWLAYLLMI